MLARIISGRYSGIEGKLKGHFRELITKYLMKSLPPKDFVFFEEDELEAAVRQKTMEYDELYYKILRTPTLLAATIINYGKQELENNSTNIQKTKPVSHLLSLFFDLRYKKILPWHEIFNLNIPKLSEEAYRRLNWIRKLMLIFSGRYKNMRTRLRRIRSVNMSLRTKLLVEKEKEKKNEQERK